MPDNIILNLSLEDFKLLRGCVLTSRETFNCIPFKTKDIKNKLKEIDDLIKELEEGS